VNIFPTPTSKDDLESSAAITAQRVKNVAEALQKRQDELETHGKESLFESMTVDEDGIHLEVDSVRNEICRHGIDKVLNRFGMQRGYDAKGGYGKFKWFPTDKLRPKAAEIREKKRRLLNEAHGHIGALEGMIKLNEGGIGEQINSELRQMLGA